jgi:acyl carrier protein
MSRSMNELRDADTVPTTRERLIGLVRQMLGAPAASRPIQIDARLADLGLSSIKMVNLMLAIEAEFDITIPQTEITPDNLDSIASVERLLERLAASTPGS